MKWENSAYIVAILLGDWYISACLCSVYIYKTASM
jgi:hypothetical protein